MSCKLISLDTSTKISGIAVFINGELSSHSAIDLSKEKDMNIRFNNMSKRLWAYLESENPDIIYIEEMVVTRNANTQRFLTRLQGVVYAWCMLNNCDFNTIRPSVWRKFDPIEHKGKKRDELKEEAVSFIKSKYNIEIVDDEAEAILIGLAVFEMYKSLTVEE